MLLLTIPPVLEHPEEAQQGPLRLDGVGVTFGPGIQPQSDEGAVRHPFQPKLSGSLRLAGGIPKGAQWRVWKVDARHLPALRRGAALRPALGEALKVEWNPGFDGPDSLSFVADWPAGRVDPEQRIVVELRVGGRRRALAASAIHSRLLPSAPPAGKNVD